MAAQTIIEVLINARNNASAAISQVSDSFKDVEGNMLKAGAGAAAVGAATVALTKGFIEQAGSMEQNQIAFTTMLGSASKANQLLQEMSAFAARTPFNLPDIVNAGKQLLAYGTAQGDVIKTTEMLGNVAAGLGIPLGDLIYLYGTLQVQQRAYTKDLVQFTNRGIDVMTPLAQQFGVTKDKVYELASQGKIGFADVQKAFIGMTSEGGKFFNLMDKQSKSTLGVWSNMQDSITRLQIALGNALLPAVNELMANLMPLIQQFTVWAQKNPEIVKALVVAGLAIGAFGATLLALGAIIIPIVALVLLFGSGVGIAVVIIGALVAALVVVLVYWKNIVTWVTNAWQAIVNFAQAIATGVVGALQSFGNAVVGVFNSIMTWINNVIGVFRGLWAVIVDLFTGGDITATWYQYFGTTFMGIIVFIDNFRYAIMQIPTVLAAIGTAIVEFFVSIPGLVSGALTAFGAMLYNFFVIQIPFAVGFMSAQIEIFFTETIPAAWTALVNFFTVSVPAFIGFMIASIQAWILQMWTDIVNFTTVTVPQAFQAMISWLFINIPIMANNVVNWIKNMADSAWKSIIAMKDNIIATVTAFINNTIALVISLYNQVVAWFKSLVNDVTNGINALPGNIAAAMDRVKDAAVSKAQEIYNGVKGWFDQIVGFFNNIIGKANDAINAANKAFQAGRSAGGKQGGGIVPGPIGAPVMQLVHGGEEVVPFGLSSGRGGGSGVTIQVNVGLYAGSETEKRNIAVMMYDALLQLAMSQNKTVQEFMGG